MELLVRNLKRIKLVTFDVTNTLLYFKNPPEVQYLKTAAMFGISEESFDSNLMKKNFRKHFKIQQQKHPNFGRNSISYQKWWEDLVINVFMSSSRHPIERRNLKPVAHELINLYKTRECWEKYEKSNELISDLKDAGKCVGVISNFDSRLHDLLHDMNITKLDFVITSYEAGSEKPNPVIYNEALLATNQIIKPSEALHIGNELDKDYNGAMSAGWSSILINSQESQDYLCFRNVQDLWESIRSRDVKI
ncbi:CLUMA_CG019020, isoform A [Clunio marinus]|uniref:CLUMA_CG019020, isoform A n=1 Tax=Clunio marinus TaxID=568069 RepID=A0A1J1J2I5_9DIPT|nr:CLUMA_CG019020, isoform A [Clunio marinus]